MSCGATHKFIGGIAGFAITALDECDGRTAAIRPITSVTVGSFFGALPDLLEPALRNPHHRQFCHGLVTLACIGYGVRRAYLWEPTTCNEKFWRSIALVAGGAYLSHLLLDCLTPRSLPIFGKL